MSAPFTAGEKVFSVNQGHHPGCSGVILSIKASENRDEAPEGYVIHAEMKTRGAKAYCIFTPSDLMSLEKPLREHECRILEFLRQKERMQ